MLNGTDLVKLCEQQQALGIKAQTNDLKVVKLPEHDGEYAVIDPRASLALVSEGKVGGGVMLRTPRPQARNYAALTLQALVGLAVDLSGGEKDAKTLVMVSMKQVVVLLDEKTRTERITLKLEESSTWKLLRDGWADEDGDEDGETHPALTQRDAVDLLKRRVFGELTPENVVTNLRTLKFTASSEGQSSLQHGRESMGKSVDASVTGADSLPEMVLVDTAVWDNVRLGEGDTGEPIERQVALVLDTDIPNSRIYLRPRAGCIEEAERSALEDLTKHLREEFEKVDAKHVRVFAGVA